METVLQSEFRRCLHSTSSHELSILRIRVSTYSDHAFPVTTVRLWNSLPQHITSAPSLPVFCCRLKTYFFKLCYRNYCCRACKMTLSFMDTLIALTYLFYLPTLAWCCVWTAARPRQRWSSLWITEARETSACDDGAGEGFRAGSQRGQGGCYEGQKTVSIVLSPLSYNKLNHCLLSEMET